jgi:hypothetical protein
MLPDRLTPTGEPADPGEAPFDAVTRSSAREETMASWQIKGLLVLSAALAAITLAASAPAVEERPAQVVADRMPAARIGTTAMPATRPAERWGAA